jgi:hypothetical protein
MFRSLIPGALSALALAALAASPALAAGPAPAVPSIPTGQTVSLDVPASPSGYTQSWTFPYPGDNSNLTVDAEVNGLDPSYQTAVGFNVFDVSHQTAPVEIANLQTNQKSNDPHGIEFNYSSGTQGTVTIQLFSYAPVPVSLNVSQSGLQSINSGTAPAAITLTGPGGAAAPAPAAPAAPAPAPVASPAAGGPGVASGQSLSLNVPASPGGYTKSWKFDYPGDNSTITFDAEVGGLDPSFQTAVGFNVYDSQNAGTPVEIATLASNGRSNDPHGIEFVYSSGTAGSVTVQFFSYAPAPVTLNLTQGGLVSPSTAQGNTITPVTLQAA